MAIKTSAIITKVVVPEDTSVEDEDSSNRQPPSTPRLNSERRRTRIPSAARLTPDTRRAQIYHEFRKAATQHQDSSPQAPPPGPEPSIKATLDVHRQHNRFNWKPI